MNYITMREFGRWGRWANQLFQFAFLRLYARQWECQLQLPAWAGNQLLEESQDPPVTVSLPERFEQTDSLEEPVPPKSNEYVNHDFRGYAQYHTSYYCSHAEEIKCLWRASTNAALRMDEPLLRLVAGHTVIGVHIRRGDYGRSIFYVTPVAWYLDWLKEHWAGFKNPVLFVATEDKSVLEDLAEYHPVTATDLGVFLVSKPLANHRYLGVDLRTPDPIQMDFFPDWYLLSMCDVLLTPNSTFSFTAGMANPRLKEFWRSNLKTQRMERIDPWDSYPLTHDKAENYRHIPGVCLDETPYWKRTSNGFEERR